MKLTELNYFELSFLSIFIVIHGLIFFIFLIYVEYDKKNNRFVGWSGESWLFDRLINPKLSIIVGKFLWLSVGVLFVISGLSLMNSDTLNLYASNLIKFSSLFGIFGYLILFDGVKPSIYNWILGLVVNLVLLFFFVFLADLMNIMIAILLIIVFYGIFIHNKIIKNLY